MNRHPRFNVFAPAIYFMHLYLCCSPKNRISSFKIYILFFVFDSSRQVKIHLDGDHYFSDIFKLRAITQLRLSNVAEFHLTTCCLPLSPQQPKETRQRWSTTSNVNKNKLTKKVKMILPIVPQFLVCVFHQNLFYPSHSTLKMLQSDKCR